MPLSQVITPDINEGIDRKTLKTLRQRFMQINEGRLERAKERLSERHRAFLNALPLMLHVNHPLLPGYVSGKTPAGISRYEPEKVEIRALQSFVHGYQFRREASPRCRLFNVSLMGSSGTVAYSAKSDMDFWVVHDPDIEPALLDELQKKLFGIEKWAAKFKLEVHFFLINPDKFKAGKTGAMSGDDCGSTQHYLLLDEFYRTSLLIAGRYPVWWLVPSDQEKDYDNFAQTLVRKRFVPPDETFDLGDMASVPPGEFLGAGLWQLYKGIDSPYKSVIKILLTEVYASEYPEVKPLSLRFKEQVYQGKLDLDELDPYVLLYRKIEEYLIEKEETTRLELLRRCLYFKVNQPLTRGFGQRRKSWRYLLMERLTQEWGWDQPKLHSLDVRPQWKVNRVTKERKLIVNELNYSYRFLSRFARENASKARIDAKDMTILGRKLYAAFERKSGKIELINPNISPDISEDQLTLYQLPPKEGQTRSPGWALFRGVVRGQERANAAPVKRGRSVIELLAWGYFNGIIENRTRFYIDAPESHLTDHELQRTVACLFQLFPERVAPIEQEQFEKPAEVTHISFFINVGMDPMADANRRGIQRLTNNTDAFKYSAMHNNLVLSVDQISVNSWGEVVINQFNDGHAVIACLIDFLKQNPPAKTLKLPQMDFRCFCPTRPLAIAKRVKELYFDVIETFYGRLPKIDARYVVEYESQFYAMYFEGNQPKVKSLRNYGTLLKFLGKPQPTYSQIVLDRHALEGSILSLLCKLGKADDIQVFYLKREERVDVYVLDELGSLFQCKMMMNNEGNFISHMYRFIQSTLYRQQVEHNLTETEFRDLDVSFYEIIPPQPGKPIAAERRAVPRQTKLEKFYNVQVILGEGINDQPLHTIYCDHREFSELEYGTGLFDAVADHILSVRQSDIRYPCYITDLDLTRAPQQQKTDRSLQMSEYLRYKYKLEILLNKALMDH